MQLVDRKSFLWEYLQPDIQKLLTDGELLVQIFSEDSNSQTRVDDFSFMVFPFAKAYEGFLKKLFLDIKVIQYDEYYGDDIRIGRVLNPQYQKEVGNVFAKMCAHSPSRGGIVQHLWDAWKDGRNLVFHYFPHNYKRLSFEDAMTLINKLLHAMSLAVIGCDLKEYQARIHKATSTII